MCFANKDNIFGRMSRIKSRAQVEVCGDCGASGLLFTLRSRSNDSPDKCSAGEVKVNND